MTVQRQIKLASVIDPAPSHLLTQADSEIEADHADEPLSEDESARFWKHSSLDEIELFHGSYRTYRFAKHFHRVPAIGVINRGAMSTYYRRSNHVLPEGTVLLLNAGEVHAPAPAAEPGWSFRMFYLPPSFLASMCPELPHSPLHFKTPFLQNPALAQSLLHLHGAMEEPAHRLELQSALSSVLADLSESYAFEPLFKAPSKSDRSSMRLALDYLHENYYLNPTLEELAALSPFGPSHFLRSFRATVGLTPHAYLLQLRVERAMTLLHTRTPIVEIANALGFVDQSHFTRIFKRILGITPSRFLANTR